MTVWKIVRGIWTVVAFPCAAIVTLNIERIAEAHRLDQMVPDPAKQLAPLTEWAQQPLVIFFSVLICGVTIGLWADTVFRRLLSRKVPTRKTKLVSLGYEMHAILHRANHLRNFTYSRSALHEERLLSADLNVLLTKTANFRIPTPPTTATVDQIEDYLARVGARLIAGDEATAVAEAKR